MAFKRRKLSPSASSQSSTPAPTAAYSLHPPSSPVPSEPVGGPGSSRLSNSATPGPAASQSLALSQSLGVGKIDEDRATAKPGVIQPGSGDGTECGDECYIWTDLPMTKNGELAKVYTA